MVLRITLATIMLTIALVMISYPLYHHCDCGRFSIDLDGKVFITSTSPHTLKTTTIVIAGSLLALVTIVWVIILPNYLIKDQPQLGIIKVDEIRNLYHCRDILRKRITRDDNHKVFWEIKLKVANYFLSRYGGSVDSLEELDEEQKNQIESEHPLLQRYALASSPASLSTYEEDLKNRIRQYFVKQQKGDGEEKQMMKAEG